MIGYLHSRNKYLMKYAIIFKLLKHYRKSAAIYVIHIAIIFTRKYFYSNIRLFLKLCIYLIFLTILDHIFTTAEAKSTDSAYCTEP